MLTGCWYGITKRSRVSFIFTHFSSFDIHVVAGKRVSNVSLSLVLIFYSNYFFILGFLCLLSSLLFCLSFPNLVKVSHSLLVFLSNSFRVPRQLVGKSVVIGMVEGGAIQLNRCRSLFHFFPPFNRTCRLRSFRFFPSWLSSLHCHFFYLNFVQFTYKF